MTTDSIHAAAEEKTDEQTLDPRDVRALTEELTVLEHIGHVRGADEMYLVVSASGKEYTVDVVEGACTCPDFEHNLPLERPDGTTRHTCKHLAAVTYTTGLRPIPAWVDPEAICDQLLEAHHVDGSPRFAGGDAIEDDLEAMDDAVDRVAPDYDRCGAETQDGSPCRIAAGRCPHHERVIVTDGGEDEDQDVVEDQDQDECEACGILPDELPCFPCFSAERARERAREAEETDRAESKALARVEARAERARDEGRW